MKKYILGNNIKLIYEHRDINLTSFCIGFNAGALEENGFNFGTAHAVEHMVYKGTVNRSEIQINILSDELFGFSNAMTNYPYSIYYGTLSSNDFNRGFELLSDIVMNPVFPEEGFKEEISVIQEELKDWEEDLSQHCEDLLFSNAFKERRIRELIIGNKKSIENITLKEIKNFYDKYYSPSNCVISVVSSLAFEEILKIVNHHIGSWKKDFCGLPGINYEYNTAGIFYAKSGSGQGARIMYCFSLQDLNDAEMSIMQAVNIILGDGVSSILYDTIRTQKGFAYDVYSAIKNERGIKLLNISISTSKDKVNDIISLVDECILKAINKALQSELLEKAYKRYRLKNEFLMERSIELSKRLTTYELMFEDSDKVFNELENNPFFEVVKVKEIITKVLKNPTIQILQ